MYSWLLTTTNRLAFTKAHIAIVRDMLTDPDKLPEPPFAFVLADSGQKQLIFRATVAYDKASFIVMLEDTHISITPEGLRARIELAGSISRKIGKPVLKEPPTVNTYIGARKAGVMEALKEWDGVRNEPLSQLAAWLAPPKDKE
jgi:hypothetical protein